MRRPLLVAIIMAVALVLVLISQARLKRFIKEGALTPEASSPQQDLAVPRSEGAGDNAKADPDVQSSPESQPLSPGMEAPVEAEEGAKEKVMAALLETRKSFRTREKTRSEVRADPHMAPPSIINAAAKLSDLLELEKQYPQFKNDFQTFYLECARDAKVITVTRVQCLEKYFLSRGASEAEKEQTLQEMPPIVQRLYKELEQD